MNTSIEEVLKMTNQQTELIEKMALQLMDVTLKLINTQDILLDLQNDLNQVKLKMFL